MLNMMIYSQFNRSENGVQFAVVSGHVNHVSHETAVGASGGTP